MKGRFARKSIDEMKELSARRREGSFMDGEVLSALEDAVDLLDGLRELVHRNWMVGLAHGPHDTQTGGYRVDFGFSGVPDNDLATERPTLEAALLHMIENHNKKTSAA